MAAAAAARKPRSKSLPRRTPDFVRPYLTKQELTLLLSALDSSDDALVDPSLSSAIAELRRWAH